MTKQFKVWLMDDVLKEAGGSFWQRMHMTPSAPAAPASMDTTSEPAPAQNIDQYVSELAHVLGISEQVAKSNYLRHQMEYIVKVMHPVAGHGGKITFDALASITDAVVRNSMGRGELDPDNDEHLKMASSPVKLINALRSIWGNFHPKIHLEGGTKTHDANVYDRWFINKDALYRRARLGKHADGFTDWHKAPEKPQPAAPGAATPTGTPDPNIVIRSMMGMPSKFFIGHDMVAVSGTAQAIARHLGVTPPGEAELRQFMKDKGLVGGG